MKKIFAAGLAAALLSAACNDPLAPAPPTPVAPTITDSFTGNLAVLTTNSHPFIVNAVGSVFVTLTSVDPAATLGIGVGTPSTTTGTCVPVSSVATAAGTSPQLKGTATVKGNFCIAVADIGNLVEPVDYTITVLHP